MTLEEFKDWNEVRFPFSKDSISSGPYLYAWSFGDKPFYVGESGSRRNGIRVIDDYSLTGKRGAPRRDQFKHCAPDFDVAQTRDNLIKKGHPITLRFIPSLQDDKKRTREEKKIIRSLLFKGVILLNFFTGCCRAETVEEEKAALERFCDMLCSRD